MPWPSARTRPFCWWWLGLSKAGAGPCWWWWEGEIAEASPIEVLRRARDLHLCVNTFM